MPTESGSDAAAQEVMPGETSGEVMRRKASAEVMPPSVGRNATRFSCSFLPVIPNPDLLLFLTTCNMELATELLQVISGFSGASHCKQWREKP